MEAIKPVSNPLINFNYSRLPKFGFNLYYLSGRDDTKLDSVNLVDKDQILKFIIADFLQDFRWN